MSEALVTVVEDKVLILTPAADKLRFRVCGGSQSDQDRKVQYSTYNLAQDPKDESQQ